MKVVYILTGIIVFITIVLTVAIGPYLLRVQHFNADPENGYYADFYLYVSPGAKSTAGTGAAVTLLVQPNNSGINSDDPAIHRKDAWWMGFGRHKLADDLQVALLVPSFVRPAEDWWVYTHALDRDVFTTQRTNLARLDLQLLAMVDRARADLEKNGLATNERFLLQGFSASGMFANRFTALHPDHVLAVAAGSPGGWPIAPVATYEDETLSYPVGIGDLGELTGRAFDNESYQSVPQIIVMGSLDENDSLDFEDGWDSDSAAQVDRLFGPDPISRWEDAANIYKNSGADARFILIDGVGHDRKKLQHHTTDFFRQILASEANMQ